MPIFETLKALHIIFIVTWFAGLFYIVRLFIYSKEAQELEDEKIKEALTNQYAIMKKRLWYGITWPSAVLTLIFGLSLITYYLPSMPLWLLIKLFFLVLLYIYHFYCGYIYKSQAKNNYNFSAYGLRIFNELATLFLFAIVFLVKLKAYISVKLLIFGLIALSALLLLSIWIYNKRRNKKESI